MKKLKLKSLKLIPIFIFFACSFSYSQTTVGKIYLKEEADKLFGPVHQFIKLPVEQFESLLGKCGEYMMFRFEGYDLYVLDSKKTVLYSTTGVSKEFLSKDVMKYYSTSVIKELLSKGQSTAVLIETRESVMSVTSGDYTMENSVFCPPYCPETY